MASSSSGASVGVRVPEPAVDLAPLVQHLAAAVRPWPTAHPKAPETVLPFVTWDPKERALVLDTNAALRRLWRTGKALEAMRSFLVDADVPRAAARAHLGGTIRPGTDAQLHDATSRLVTAIDDEIDAALQAGFDPALLATTPATSTLGALGKRLGVDLYKPLQGPTRLSRTRIEPVAGSQEERRDVVARIMDAVEEVDGSRATYVDNFFASVEPRLRDEGYTQRQVAAALQYHRHSAEQAGTQLDRFFGFLENEALSRVRMQVGSHIMEALGAEAEERRRTGVKGDWALLATYCRRAVGLLAALGAAETPAVRLNLSAELGQRASFSLRDEVINAGFVTGLPVWPQWRTQMFEEQSPSTTPASGPTLTRELTYHFRVNGPVPETGKPSFDTRLERIENDWLCLGLGTRESEPREQRVNRSLTEVVFLWAAIPESADTVADPAQALVEARELARRLEEGGKPAIRQALRELSARADVVRRIARALTSLLQTRGTVLTRSLAGRRWDYYVNVLPTIVDWQRIAGELEGPLACSSQTAQEQIDFLRHIWITRDRSLPGALLSVRVQVRLMERSLATVGAPAVLTTRRCPPEHLTQVIWRSSAMKAGGDPREARWLTSPRVEVVYDVRTVQWPQGKAPEPGGLNALAATRSALAVLVHTTLLRLAQRAEAATGQRPAFSVLRLQAQGRAAEDLSGDEGVYAAAQAVEAVLARDVTLRMQGVAFDAYNQYKEQGAFAALFAGFPLQISLAQSSRGERPRVGVITYAARPCGEHPDFPDARGRALVLSRTYLASPIESPFAGYDVRTLGSRTEVANPTVALPETVAEELERLYAEGCRHVILIGHRFGQRRVGSGAAHPRLRDQGETLSQLAESHPDLTVYPLVRDVFDATRLRQREREDAFEILRASDHVAGSGQPLSEEQVRLRRRYEPVYSLATLHVVGGQAAFIGKPQSGFCTYFLLRDVGMAPTEVRVRLEGNLLGDESLVRPSLIGVLRSLHYLEAERAMGGHVQPVLDPFDWLMPESAGKVGEVLALPPSRRRRGSVGLSLTALLDRTSRIAHALPLRSKARAPSATKGTTPNAERPPQPARGAAREVRS